MERATRFEVHCTTASSECNEWSRFERRPMSGDGFLIVWDFCFRTSLWNVVRRWIIAAHVTRMQFGFRWITSSVAKASKHLGVSWLVADNEKKASRINKLWAVLRTRGFCFKLIIRLWCELSWESCDGFALDGGLLCLFLGLFAFKQV